MCLFRPMRTRFDKLGFIHGTALLMAMLTSIAPGAEATPSQQSTPSHKQIKAIRVSEDAEQATLNTFVMSPDRELWLCCQAIAQADAPEQAPVTQGVIQVRSLEGVLQRKIELPFVPQAINFSAEGVPYVSGQGKIARLKKDGEVDVVIDAPNLLSEEEMKAKIAASNKKMLDQLMDGQDAQLVRLQEQIEKLQADLKSEEIQANERLVKRTKVRLDVLEKQLAGQREMYDNLKKNYEDMFSSDGDTSRYKKTTGLAVSKTDLFVSLPSLEGHGYAIYRLSHDLSDAKLVVNEVHGCCGQLDIQTDGTQLIVAENSSFKVRYFDRDGKETFSFGERGSARPTAGKVAQAGWGSCCNPMNVRCNANNELLVAESSIGHIKRYTPEGDFLGLVGTAKIAGGCKHVAIAHDSESDWYYMMNTAGNNIVVLVPNDQAPAETEDERDARLAMEGLGQKLLGAWQVDPRGMAAEPSVEISVAIAENEPSEDEAAEEESAEEESAEEESAEEESADEESIEEAAAAGEIIQADEVNLSSYVLSMNRYLEFKPEGVLSRTVSTSQASQNSVSNFVTDVASLFLGTPSSAEEAFESNIAWVPIRQQGDLLEIGIQEDGVTNFAASVRFIEEDRAEFKWYFGEVAGEPVAKFIYQRVATAGSQPSQSTEPTQEAQP